MRIDVPHITDGPSLPFSFERTWHDAHLILPPRLVPSRAEIAHAINWPAWQTLRISLHGTSLRHRFLCLRNFLHEQAPISGNKERQARVVIHNYIGALKRGGLINPAHQETREYVPPEIIL